MPAVCHCERSEAIPARNRDCFIADPLRNNRIRLPVPFRAVFVCMSSHSFGVPRAARCPCVAVALADKPPVALLYLKVDTSE
jgi:hypothetical protein